MRRYQTFLTAVSLGMVASACAPGPQPLQYGVHECRHCRMTLMDERYGGEIVTRTGKIYAFDSVECLVAYLEAGEVPDDQIHAAYVVDYGNPKNLVRSDAARYLKSTQLLSPMGANVTAFARVQDAEGARNVFGGEVVSWEGARRVIAMEWLPNIGRPAEHGGI